MLNEEPDEDEWDKILKAQEYIVEELHTPYAIQQVLHRYQSQLAKHEITLGAFLEIQKAIADRLLQLCKTEFERATENQKREMIFQKYAYLVSSEQLPPELIGRISALFFGNNINPTLLQYRKDEK